MELNEYVKECWKQVEEYVLKVPTNEIKSNKWIKLAVQRFISDANRDDLEFRVDMVDRVFKFFYFININIDNKYRRIKLMPFQAFAIAALFGFYYKKTNKRKHRYAFLFMSRKNGKSVFAASLQLYFLLGDGVEDPQSLLVASTREQAQICLEYATGIINHSPMLAKRLETQRFKILFRDRTKSGFSKTLASNAHKLDGYSASGAILDEIHAYPNDALFNVIKSSILARENPMIFLISTAGFSLTSFAYNYVKYAKNVLSGDINDDTLFPMIFQLDEGDDYKDTELWYKSNPGLGVINHIEDLKSEFNSAQYSFTQLNSFLTKHLNIFVEEESAWIPNDVLSKVFKKFDDTILNEKECYIGIDLSQTRDLTSIVALFNVNDHFYVKSYFFMPDDGERMLRSGGLSLLEWIKEGLIFKSNTKTIDYDSIRDTLIMLKNKYNIRIIYYDPSNSALFLDKLKGTDLLNKCKPFPQRTYTFNEPLKYLEKIIFEEEVTIDNPVLKWNFNNALIYTDGNGNIKIMKNKSSDSVDGTVALGMAAGGYLHMYAGRTMDVTLWEN